MYQCYAPLSPVQAIVGQGGDLINLHINCPNIWDTPNNQIPLQKVGDYWGFDTPSVTVQYTETVAVLRVSSEVIKCPTIGAASFGQSPYVARLLPVRGVVGHNIDRCITRFSPRLVCTRALTWDECEGGDSRGVERVLACARLQTRESHARACYLTCDLYCSTSVMVKLFISIRVSIPFLSGLAQNVLNVARLHCRKNMRQPKKFDSPDHFPS